MTSTQTTDGIQTMDDDPSTIHLINISQGVFPEQIADRIECGDTIEFENDQNDEFDVFQVYQNQNEFYRIDGGSELFNVRKNSSVKKRRLILSFHLHQNEMELHFCIIPSNQRQTFLKSPRCPVENCEKNHFILHKNELKISLTDAKESQKLIIHHGDTIELEWTSKRGGGGYRIEEKKYCPISGGLYKVEQSSDMSSTTRVTSKGTFRKTFNEFGTSFLFRLTETNQIQDIIVCIIKEKYRIERVEITDTHIQPNVTRIEQNDVILFEWNTKDKQTIGQIEPFNIDQAQQRSIEMRTQGKDFFWPYEPSNRGCMMYEFKETGIFCFKTANNQIGTIIVQPKRNVHSFPVFGEQLILKMNTNDLLLFEWKMSDSQDEPILITVDANSSVVPDDAGGLMGIFDCSMHQCVKVEPFFRHHFHTCEAFLMEIPEHGLYTFAYSDNREDVVLSVIVENSITNHRVAFNEQNLFEPETLLINRHDQVWFESLSTTFANIYQTNEYGQTLEGTQAIFQPQLNSINYFMKQFEQVGIYYFTTDIQQEKEKKPSPPLAVIVLPDIRFHYQLIRLSDFDSQALITNINDFVIWQFEEIIQCNLIQLRSNETLENLVSCHERAVRGRNRQCLAVECIMPGIFFFANPEFERVTGSEEDRLISTIIIDPPFSQACFLVNNGQFVPNRLCIKQNDTVSWIPSYDHRNYRISVEQVDNQEERNDNSSIDRAIDERVPGIYHLHTFGQCGQFTIRAERLENTATVVVYPEDIIRNQKKRVQRLELLEDIETVSQYGTRIHVKCPDEDATMFYTLDGTLPTRRYQNVHINKPDEGIPLLQPGLQILRAYATENDKLPSVIITSSPTFVMEANEAERMNELQSLWKSTKIILSASILYPNKLYGKIEVDPINATDLIDHFELYVDDVAQKVNLAPTDVKFSAEGFAGGEQYEIYILACPKQNIVDVEPIPSNRRAFEIKRDIQGGAPLISLAVSNEQSTIFLMWAHVGDQVSEYVVYVNNIETTIITEKDFNDFFGVQFHGAQQRKRYLLHVEARIKDSNEVRKSNIIAVNPPLEMPLKEQLVDRYFAYITVNAEAPPPDMRLEVIHLDQFPHRRPEPQRKVETLPITNGLRNAVPKISLKPNPNGVTLYWTKKPPALSDFVQGYRVMVNGEQHGELISPQDEPSVQLTLPDGKHECYVAVIPKDKDQEVYESNILQFHVPYTDDDQSDQEQGKQSSDASADGTVQQKNIPVPKLNAQIVNASVIRASWNLDRPMPTGISLKVYEVHVRGQNFPNTIKSDRKLQQDDDTEHVWNVTKSSFEISGVSDRYEYTVFVRALYTVQDSGDTDAFITISNEVVIQKVTPSIDLIPRPVLKVIHVGLQMAHLSWRFDDSVDQSLIKGYRIFSNTKATETLAASRYDYELRNLQPGTTNDVQVSVACQADFSDEKISELVRIVCPPRPQPPKIQSIRTDKLYSIVIQWNLDDADDDDDDSGNHHHHQNEITTFKIFLNGKLHGEIDIDDNRSFNYEFTKLQADPTYLIHVKTCIGQKKLGRNAYQCEVESQASNELSLKCLAPPKGTPPRIERMHPNGVDIVWDAPVENDDVKITGYQILRNGRAVGRTIPVDRRQASIQDLEVGNRYSLQVVPMTDHSDSAPLDEGEEYDPERHDHCLPGPKLEVEYSDLVQIPSRLWIENISGRSAVICWSSIDSPTNPNTQPDSYKLFIWNNKTQTRDQATVIPLAKDKTNHTLKDLQSAKTYAVQLEGFKKRRYQKTNETYIVSTSSNILTFSTGAPPDPPSNLYVITSTNTAARIGFDAFIEHNAEIISLRVHCESVSVGVRSKEIVFDLTPDSTNFTLSNLTERTDYSVTIYAITEEYLNDIYCNDISQLPKKLKPSSWLTSKNLQFTTSGCEPANQLRVLASTVEFIQLEWILPKAYGSTKLLGQILHWKCERGGDERSMKLDDQTNKVTIPGILPLGLYKISLEALFSMRTNLDRGDDDKNRKEIRLTTTETASVRFRTPGLSERPEVYLTGYTSTTIDLTWNKPNMFTVIDHPEKLNEVIKIHRRLLGYRVEINGEKYNTLSEDQYQCTLTECRAGEEYRVQLVAQTVIQNEYISDAIFNDEETDETPSKKIRVRMLKNEDLLRSFQANFEFHHTVTKENTTEQRNEVKPIGKINVNWTVADTKNISHILLQWHSSKDLRTQEKKLNKTDTSFTIDATDEKYFYIIEIIIVTNDGTKHLYEPLTMPIPGEPDAPKLWLVKTSNTSFVVEWSEPKSYGIPVIGFQLYIAGEKAGDMAQVNLRRAEIPSNINRSYQINVCAVTNNPQRSRSGMSQTLSVLTTPPTMTTENPIAFDRTVTRTIPVKIDSINEEKLYVDWSTFVPMMDIRGYYIHYTCLNNAEVQTVKLSKRHRNTVLRDLKPGFTYAIMVVAVDDHGEILYSSEKNTIQMSAPPNAPIVAIRERTNDRVTIEWRPSPNYGELTIVGYKVYINNRLVAILSHDQLTYTFTNGSACEDYTVYVQALSNDKNISSPMSRGIKFTWPGIKPGIFRRLDDGQTGTVVVAWEHPQIEDDAEKVIGFRVISENTSTHAVRLHGQYESDTHQATIYDLINGKYRLWLEIQSEHYCVRSRPITIGSTRFRNRHSLIAAKCFMKKQKRSRSTTTTTTNTTMPLLRQIQYS